MNSLRTPITALSPSPDLTLEQFRAQRQWHASISMLFENRSSDQKTILRGLKHQGPLRIQKPFYPMSLRQCHAYLLHPPGGLVSGDKLLIEAELKTNSHVLLTTPSAGKAYRCLEGAPKQSQDVSFVLDKGAILEWMPQGNIFFNDAKVDLNLNIDMAEDAKLLAWEINCFGRPAGSEPFTEGRVRQSIDIRRGGKPFFIERTCFDGGSDMMSKPWGLASHSVIGTFIATHQLSELEIASLRQRLAERYPELVLTQKPDCLILRYLGDSIEKAQAAFEHAWQYLRPIMIACDAVRPRIWNT